MYQLEILSKTNQGLDEKVISNNDESNDHSGKKVPWMIETKYYKAKVDFWIDETAGRDDVNWEVVAGYVKTKSKEECEKHYKEVYYNSDKWPLPKIEVKRIKDELLKLPLSSSSSFFFDY